MLNDLYVIERGLVASGVATIGRHPDIKDMAKGPAIQIRLAADGSICEIDRVPEAGRGQRWTLRDAQHNGFPGLKTAAGLLAIDPDELELHNQNWDAGKAASARRAELTRLLAHASFDDRQHDTWPNKGHRRRIAERLDCLRPLADDPDTASVPASFERFLKALRLTPSFLEQLAQALASKVRSAGEEWLEPARAAFVGPVPLCIDVSMDGFDRDAGDPRQAAAVSAVLAGATAPASANGATDGYECALTGASARLHSGNFPQPNLPGLGQSYIFARNRDIPSLTRYGRTADASFAIDADLVRRLAGVLDVLTHPDAKDRTWRLIPAESGDRFDLLIVSLPAAANEPVAGTVAEDDEEITHGASRLVELASRVIKHSRGQVGRVQRELDMVVTVLRTVDPANRKTVYQRRISAEELFVAARDWQAACQNVPAWISFYLPVKGETLPVERRPPLVAPLSLTPLSRALYANGGRRKVDVVGVSASQAFGLFLRQGDVRQRARSLLRLMLLRHGPLLAGLTAARAKGSRQLKAFDPKADLRRDGLRSITWMAVLLYFAGRAYMRDEEMPEVGSYKEDVAFRLGQFLAAADLIHIGYCADLRGGDVPPSLLGNSVLSVAGSDPVRALAILQTRMKPYFGWARRADQIYTKATQLDRAGEKSRAIALRQGVSQARRADDLARTLAARLAAYTSKERKPDDAFKAELLLGYVAGQEPLPKRNGSDTTLDYNAPAQTEGTSP